MRGRLLTNGILSIAAVVFWVIAIVSLVKAAQHTTYDSIDNRYYVTKEASGGLVSFGISYLFIFGLWIANLVMGIVTLAMPKNDSVRGLTIASGVLAILGGVFGVNAIVSFIAYDNSEPTTKSEQN